MSDHLKYLIAKQKQEVEDYYEHMFKEEGYEGCRNCKYQIEPFRMCEWAEFRKVEYVSPICRRWEKRGKEGRE